MLPAATGIRSPVDRFFEFSLLGLLASGYLAVVGSGYLDAPTAILTAVALLVRGLLVSNLIQYRIPPGLVAAATLGYMGFYPVDYLFISKSFLQATVHLVFFIAIVKILTASTNRDYFFVKLIAFMELLAACVLSSSINFFVFLTLFLLLGVSTFASSEIRRSAQRFARPGVPTRAVSVRLASVAVLLAAGILLLTGALFFLLPRTARAAFQHLFSHRYHIAGFSNEVSLGEIGEIQKQDTPVMHIKMTPMPEHPQLLRWRGSALAQFDGHRWFNTKWRGDMLRPNAGGQLRLSGWRPGTGLSSAVHVNDVSLDGVLFFAGTPQFLQIDAPLILHTSVDSYRLISGNSTSLNYQVFSYLEPSSSGRKDRVGERPPIALTPEQHDLYLRLPAVDARIWTLSQSVAAGDPAPEAKARAIETYLKTTYQYTLDLPKAESADPLANFLFSRKKGHCEYFASSMAVMLRTIGIPSRVVTGFLGGMYNPISGWQIIRASDAHSWVEAYIPRLGWTTFDPTPTDTRAVTPSMLGRLGLYVDAAEVFWQDWVINYSLDSQLLLASRMEQSGRSLRMSWIEDLENSWPAWKSKASTFGWVYALLLIPGAVLLVLTARYGSTGAYRLRSFRRIRSVKRGQVHRSDATLLYERMLKTLRRRGIEKSASLTPSEFAEVLSEPALSSMVADITSAYNELRFGGKPEAGMRMMEVLRRLERHESPAR
ncbi:MAG: DUF3488 and transglutaminase-like domain-containing protein [Acidobacteriota bacterium]|nr:DUF3488 and transglutaminase-like domain-containing protein [Acidobacteriota bacterium]